MPSQEKHPASPLTISRDQKIWRYMSLAKYMSFLVRRCLWFSRIDRLGDPFEGKYPKRTIQRYGLPPEMGNIADVEWLRQWTYVNCWYISDYESAAMWQLYASNNEAVALQSTYERLHLQLPADSYIGEVRYIDFENDFLGLTNAFTPFMHKRISFSHERELRALIDDPSPAEVPTDQPDAIDYDQNIVNSLSGLEVTVDVHELVDRIHVAPTAPQWFKGLIEEVSARFGFAKTKVAASELDEVPY